MGEDERISRRAVVLNFPANDDETTSSSSLSPPLKAPPRRLRRHLLLAEAKTPLSAQHIEAKLKEADLRRQREKEEDFRQRRSEVSHLHVDSKLINEQPRLSRMLPRYGRRFVEMKKTTISLARAYLSLEINEESVKSMSFEQLATCIESSMTVKTVGALVKRLESCLRLSETIGGSQYIPQNIDHLLRNTIERGARTVKPIEEEAQTSVNISRYPVKVLLCAYMILGHPNVVLNGQSRHENTLTESAGNMVREFELLVKTVTHGPIKTSEEAITSSFQNQKTFRSQLEAYDKAWCPYLHQFVVWKLKDAKLLEDDLIRASCQLELSMMKTCKLTLGDDGGRFHYKEAIKKQGLDEQNLLRENVQHISGSAGLEHLEHALAEVRSKFIEGKESGSPSEYSTNSSASGLTGPLKGPAIPISMEPIIVTEGCQASGSTINSSDHSLSSRENGPSPRSITNSNQSSDSTLRIENELLVNEIIHEHHHRVTDNLNAVDRDQNTVKEKVRETMENAFWNGVMESIKQDKPDFSWILKLMKEVRDDLCEMSPQSWRQEIVETVDVDGLSQVLKSGIINMDYLRKSLEFALVTIEKLSAPANDEEIKSSHNKLLRELEETSEAGDKSSSSFSLLMIKGLRNVLREIQDLKKEISKAHLKFVEPIIKGSAGLEYLKRAFCDRYGPPADASPSLILTKQLLSAILPTAEQEWNEYKDSLLGLASDTGSTQVIPKTLRTGGTITVALKAVSSDTGCDQPECKGERMDMFVRLILLKLVSGMQGLTSEALPETVKLNLSKLRVVQSQFQKIIVISTSMLILRQMFVTEKLVTNFLDVEKTISECTKQLSELLDHVNDAGISEIVTVVSGALKGGSSMIDTDNHQAKQKIIKSMLQKSLQAEDAIFAHVSHCAYLALRCAVLGGSGYKGRQLVVTALQRIGAAVVADSVMEAAEILIVMATVSCSVHGAWYEELLKSM
ncbi:uncharacterized protein LOC126659468 isoform X2 [Mercurialis annua]|uniref:uncharacterized protein LOC126659468 isoform X2 n=1 Tax=Mercurialis annua TaxID=3986 RepID=UPI00215E060D|nr:uncharacterized protein LOC126659468 isoform X2 [Mercurialis annua]